MEARTSDRTQIPPTDAVGDASPFRLRDALVAGDIGPSIESARTRTVGSAAKRAFDVVACSIGIVALSPLLIAIAIAIKLDTRGPLLFRQRRIGRDGAPFMMLKFRTMIDGADERKRELAHLNEREGLFKISGDPRVTRVGSFLRSTSLDELPQLIDVILGRMSLVGPRPLVPEEDARITGPFRRRLRVRPGMTGPWQVAGASQVPLSAMAAMDFEYVDEQSFFGDLELIVMTVPHVLLRRGI